MQRLAQLPPSLLEAYRKRNDDSAQRLLRQGQDRRDPVSLRKLVDEMFCSRQSPAALDLLGSLAFERGQFGESLHWWNQMDTSGQAASGGQRQTDSGPRIPRRHRPGQP